MSAVVLHEGFEVRLFEGEARVRDLDVAERARLGRPRDIRTVIDRNRAELSAHGEIRVCGLEPQTSGGRPGTEYWLNEAQAMNVVALMRTSVARELRPCLVKAFIAQRREVTSPLPVVPELANGARMGDTPEMRTELREAVGMTSRAARISVRRVHGYIRRVHRISSPYFLSLVFWPQLKAALFEIAMGRVTLAGPRPRLLQGGNVRQLSFPTTT